jgi:iron(III) transport system substrate-binding protein
MLAAMIDAIGAAKAEEWVRGLVQNLARSPRGTDADQVRAILNLEGTIAIINSNSFAAMLASSTGDLATSLQEIAVFFPNQHERGVSINISGVGVATHAPHQANAIKFMTFLLSPDSQRMITDVNFDYPVRNDVPPTAALAAWGAFKADELRAAAMGQNNAAAIDIMNRVGWR